MTSDAISLSAIAAVLLLLSAFLGYWLWQKFRQGETAKRPEPLSLSIDELIPDSKFLDLDGIGIHYVQSGHGPDLVLLHGIGASVFIWRLLFPLLTRNFRVTAFDLPGFGKSSKDAKANYGLDPQTDTLARAMSELKINKAKLVGSSMGGAIALWLGLKYPERFQEIAVIAPATDSSLVPAHVKHFAVATPVLRRAFNRRTMRLILSRVLARKELITDAVIDSYMAPFLENQNTALRAFWSATAVLADKRLPKELSSVRSRTLIIYGEKDLLVSWRSMNQLKKHMPEAQYITHQEAGHHLMEDEPLWLANELEKFFTLS